VIGSPVTSAAVSGGAASASFSLAGVPAGSYSICATYNQGPNFLGSTATPATLSVGQKATTLVLATPSPVQYSDQVTLSVTVSPAIYGGDTATGNVEFFINGTSVGSAS